MRKISTEEKQSLLLKRAGFDEFIAQRMPVLEDFAVALGLDNPPMIVAEPQHYVTPVDEFLRMQRIADDDRTWIILRVGFLIGEVLVQRLGACWLLNENPDSRTFLRYVVGEFQGATTPAMIDPFEVATAHLSHPAPRNLVALIEEIVAEVLQVLER